MRLANEFHSQIYRTSAEMYEAIAEEYMSAGGANSAETQRELFTQEPSDAVMADDAIVNWGLDDEEFGILDFERDRLIKALGDYRAIVLSHGGWKTTEPEGPDDRLLSQCDDCGEYAGDCDYAIIQGSECLACAKCRRKAAEDDPAADRGDWEYHQRND